MFPPIGNSIPSEAGENPYVDSDLLHHFTPELGTSDRIRGQFTCESAVRLRQPP